jgi:hypothetical protein
MFYTVYPTLFGIINTDPVMPSSVFFVDAFPYNIEPIYPVYLDSLRAHTGYNSLAVKAGQKHSVTRRIDFSSVEVLPATDTSLFRNDSYDDCIGLFAPDTGYTYVYSGWVHEGLSDINSVNTFSNSKVRIYLLEGLNIVDSIDFSPEGTIIEGWQRIYGTFNISKGQDIDHIKVSLINDGGVISYFDDMRIHPFNSSMVSYVYHPIHLKIMAELDDNNFATFYEYDDEGSLVRIKKETERGILTIQESRKSVKKIQ